MIYYETLLYIKENDLVDKFKPVCEVIIHRSQIYSINPYLHTYVIGLVVVQCILALAHVGLLFHFTRRDASHSVISYPNI